VRFDFQIQPFCPVSADKDQVASSWQIIPKQDHLVCFLGGSFLLGLTEGGQKSVSWDQLSRGDWEDYQAGVGIIESCMATHDTAT
jgi:mannosyl-oligosaccharide alpha-1,2-mannosidase